MNEINDNTNGDNSPNDINKDAGGGGGNNIWDRLRRSLSYPQAEVRQGDKLEHPTTNRRQLSENTALPKEQNIPTEDDKHIKLHIFPKLLSYVKFWKKKAKEKKANRKNRELTEELKMRHKLQYHFKSPFQKYNMGRKPWKLLIQVIKIIIVTTQVILFGTERFASVAYISHTHLALKHLFIKGYADQPEFSYYTKRDVADAIVFANERFKNLANISIGIYWHDNPNQPMKFCETIYVNSINNSNNDYGPIESTCEQRFPDSVDDLLQRFHRKHYFDSTKMLYLMFSLKSMFVNGVRMLHRPECYSLSNKIYIDNTNHDGKLRISFDMEHKLLKKCPNHEFTEDNKAIQMRAFYISFDILVVTLCTLSLVLCIRSVIKSIMLASVARAYFIEYKGEVLTKWNLFELVNKWFIVIVLSDLLAIIGSLYKVRVDYRDIYYYNISSIFLGVAVLFVWIGILRFFTYVPKYNILLIALRVAAPNIMRFLLCALFMFFGFTFCGWIVLGPYHEKFDSFAKTSDCLYSLLNGDDMFVTFSTMSKASTAVWIFSKIYLYTFISLFIYVVLSTFISIVGDSYERMKLSGRMPPTRIECFMDGNKTNASEERLHPSFCDRCSDESDVPESPASCGSIGVSKELSSSQLSIMSASLE